MKVLTLAIDFLPKIGGISNHIYYLNKHLNALNVEAQVFQIIENSGREALEITDDEFVVHRLYIKDDLADLRKLKYRRIIRNIFREKFADFDIIHTHELLNTEYLVNCKNYNWVWTNHTSQFIELFSGNRTGGYFKRFVQKRVLNRASAILCVSEEIRAITERILKKNKNIHKIGSGIEVERYIKISRCDSSMWKSEFGISMDRFIILIPARWAQVKGIHLAIDAMRVLHDNHPEYSRKICFVFAGAGLGDKLYIEGMRKRLKTLDNYKIIDYVNYHDMPYIYSTADVVLLPSLYETAGIAALEAMASGKIVLASDVGGLRETIRHNINGFLYEKGNVAELVQRLLYIIDNFKSDSMEKIGGRAADFARSNYDWKKIALSVKRIYESVLNESSNS